MIAQWITDSYTSSEVSFWKKILRNRLRLLLLKFFDPLVLYKLDGMPLFLPFSHQLPVFRSSFPLYSLSIGRIAKFILAKYPNLTAIDIGANIGDTVAIIRANAHFPILCIEGDPSFFSLLETNCRTLNKLKEVTLEKSFVSANSGASPMELISEGGTGRLIDSVQKEKIVQTMTLEEILGKHQRFAEAKLLKIDTDGLDCRILEASLLYLKKALPIIFFEYDPKLAGEPIFGIFKTLKEIGYRNVIAYNNLGDYMTTYPLSDEVANKKIHQFAKDNLESYADLCVFHETDNDIWEQVNKSEQESVKISPPHSSTKKSCGRVPHQNSPEK
jgi:FkbM family methyltransferase